MATVSPTGPMGQEANRLPAVEAARRWMLSFGWCPQHMEQVARLAGEIFDGLERLHQLERRWRVILECAALIHDVGWTVSPQGHHKHASRLFLEASLPEFPDQDRELIALVARYHRKAAPRSSHRPFTPLPPDSQDAVRKLAAMIRIADGLDRSHRGAVVTVRCRIEPRRVVFELTLWQPSEADRAAAAKKAVLFSEVFGREVEFESRIDERAAEGPGS